MLRHLDVIGFVEDGSFLLRIIHWTGALIGDYLLRTWGMSEGGAQSYFTHKLIQTTTLSNGCLGSGNDEERSEMRYVMRIAELSESSNFWTQIALSGYPQEHTSLSVG